MAVLAIGVAGAAIGGAIAPGIVFGGLSGAAIGWAVGSTLGNLLFAPSSPNVHQSGPRLEDLSVQSSAYGRPIPITYGTIRVPGNIIWSAGLTEHIHEETQETGKGGGGGSVTQTTYTYTASWASAFCVGEIAGIRRIWFDSVLVYDYSDTGSDESRQASTDFLANHLTIYTGTSSQTADAVIEATEGAGNVPGFRDLAYIVIEDLELSKYGNRIPNVTAEVVKEADVGALAITTHTANVNTDSNYTIYSGDASKIYKMRVIKDLGNTEFDMYYKSTDYSEANEVSLTCSIDYTHNPTYNGNSSEEVGRYHRIEHLPEHVFLNINGTPTTVHYLRVWNHCRQVYGDTFNGDPLDWYENLIGMCGTYDWKTGNIYFLSTDNAAFDNNSFMYLKRFSGASGSISTLATIKTRSVFGEYPIGRCMSFDGYNLWIMYQPIGYSTSEDKDLYKYDTEGNLLATFTLPEVPEQFFVYAGYIVWSKSTQWVKAALLPASGAITAGATLVDASSLPWDLNRLTGAGGKFTYGDDIKSLQIPYLPAEPSALSDVVSDLCERCGLASGDIDVSGLTGLVRGYAITGVMSGRAAIEPLQRAFFFDGGESDYKLIFPPRGGASIASITDDELGATLAEQAEESIDIIRAQELELPKRVIVSYAQQEKLYQQGSQYAARQVTASVGETVLHLPLAIRDNDAAQIAEKTLHAAWTERERYSFAVPFEYAYLDPGDIVTIVTDAVTYTVRLTAVTMEAGGIIRCEGVADRAAVYTSTAVGAYGPVESDAASVGGDTTFHLMDLPLLGDSHNNPGILFVATGESNDWGGCVVYRSTDTGATYSSIGILAISAAVGISTDTLANASTSTWDDTSTVNISLINEDAELDSYNDISILNGANAAALGDAGRWEIIQFTTATLESNGSYTLSRLLRGRQGTEHNTGNHTSSDKFILLSSGTLRRVEVAQASIGQSRKYKPVPTGQTLADVSAVDYTYAGVNLKPISPVQIKGSRDGSNNLTITWLRRDRITPQNLQDPLLSESSESYEVDIMSGVTVLRTITASSETASYTAAEQTSDGLTPGDPVEVNIYQLSAVVGRGYAGNDTI